MFERRLLVVAFVFFVRLLVRVDRAFAAASNADLNSVVAGVTNKADRGDNEVCVVGGGFIGSGFCAVFLAVGKRVVCSDPYVDDQTIKRRILEIWPNVKARGLAGNHQFSPPFHRLRVEPELQKALQGVDFVQECCLEDIDIKQRVLGEIDALTDRSTVIASSTSFIPHQLLIKKCRNHKDRVVIGHPSIPHLDCFIEIYGTSESWVQVAKRQYTQFGFEVIVMKKTIPGHVLNSFLTMNMRLGAKLVRDGVCSPEDINVALRHLGREFYARNSFLSLLTDIGGDRGVDGGLDLSAKIKDNAVSIVFYSLMKKIWMPDFVARPFGKLMSMCLADSIEPPPPKDLIEACRDFESRVTKDGKLELQSGLFERSSKIYRRLPYEVGNDSFKI